MIFEDDLDSTKRDTVEGYLAHKWNLTSILPSGHTYKSTAPAVGGWSIERGSGSADELTLNLAGAGGAFSANVPINDGEWHHLVTTFGGGNKKIYVDGVEVATASQAGSVTDSAVRLVLGDYNEYGDSPDRASIDDVRFYRLALSADDVAAIYNNGNGDVGYPKFPITSPDSMVGVKGKSVKYQISAAPAYGLTGYDSAITYTLQNQPSWLSVSSSTGLVSGTPPSAGTYTFEVGVSNNLGSNSKEVTLSVSDMSAWNYSLAFTTDYAGGSPIQDWNMLVRLSDDSTTGAGTKGFRHSQARPNGSDLRFIDKNGQELKFEIANWNPGGESQVWVRVPSLASDANVTMYWGNNIAGLPAYATDGSVWDGYFGVYHLEQTEWFGQGLQLVRQRSLPTGRVPHPRNYLAGMSGGACSS